LARIGLKDGNGLALEQLTGGLNDGTKNLGGFAGLGQGLGNSIYQRKVFGTAPGFFKELGVLHGNGSLVGKYGQRTQGLT
jgi:hypothetical protein